MEYTALDILIFEKEYHDVMDYIWGDWVKESMEKASWTGGATKSKWKKPFEEQAERSRERALISWRKRHPLKAVKGALLRNQKHATN